MEKSLTTEIQKNQGPLSYFEENEQFVFVFKKTEKLVSAVYLVTNLLPTDEPLRRLLREKGNQFLSFMLTYKDNAEFLVSDFVGETKTRVLEMVSFLEVASKSGLVSAMNFSVLNQEFLRLIEAFESDSSTLKPVKNPLNEGFFGVSAPSKMSQKTSFEAGFSGARQHKEPAKSTYEKSALGVRKSDRQNIILGLLQKKSELNIKDIAEIIKDCSEKTIQRELNSLIAGGVLKRTGERRWSRYSVV